MAENGTPTNGAHIVPRTEKLPLIDFTTFPTVADVARQAGVAPQSVRRWQKEGKLTPIEDAEGTTRYDPEEVHAFMRAREELESVAGAPTQRGNMEHQLLLYPRLKIDDLFFKLLDRYEAQNKLLMGGYFELLKAKEQNISEAAEREVVATTLKTEAEMKQGLAEALTGAVPKIMDMLERHQKKKTGAREVQSDLDDFTTDELKLVLLTTGAELGSARQDLIWSKIKEKQAKEAAAAKTKSAETPAASSSTTPASSASSSTTTEDAPKA